MDVEDDRTPSDIEEEEREEGSGRQWAVSRTHPAVLSLTLDECADGERGGGW